MPLRLSSSLLALSLHTWLLKRPGERRLRHRLAMAMAVCCGAAFHMHYLTLFLSVSSLAGLREPVVRITNHRPRGPSRYCKSGEYWGFYALAATGRTPTYSVGLLVLLQKSKRCCT